MPGDDVADLMAEHAGELGLVIQLPEEPRVDVDIAARDRERVQGFVFDNREPVREIGSIRQPRNMLPRAIHVIVHRRIGVDPLLGAHLGGHLGPDVALLGFPDQDDTFLSARPGGGAS